MAGFTAELIAHVRQRYEESDDTLAKISADCGISERTINRIRDREGWSRRSDRAPRGLPDAARALDEATALLAARASPPPESVEPPAAAEGKSALERIERLVHRELAAQEAVRAQLGPLPRPPGDAERAARTLATLTQTLHALQRLRCGLPPDSESDDDDMPRDINEFRRELARRIDAFVASQTDAENAGAHTGPDALDAVR